MAVATAPVFDPELDRRVAEEVVADLLTRVGGKNLALVVTKRVPLLGGGIGAVMDGIATHQIGKYAKGELVARRALAGSTAACTTARSARAAYRSAVLSRRQTLVSDSALR